MNPLLLIVTCIAAGMALIRSKYISDDSPRVLNQLIIYFFIPILALNQIPRIQFELEFALLTIIPFFIFFLSYAFFQIINRFYPIELDTKAALILTSGIGSTSFVGFPLFELLYGDEGLAVGIILSLAGTLLVFNTAGLVTLLNYSEGNAKSATQLLRRLFLFPPFTFFFIAIWINVFDISYHPNIQYLLDQFSKPFTVIALLSIGMQIKFTEWKQVGGWLVLGLGFKIIIAPLVVYVLLWWVLDLHNVIAKVCILGAGLGSMNSMSILTAQKGLRPQLALLMPAVGIPISIATVFALSRLLL